MHEVEIPILPHVKQLLLSLYGPEPIFVHENSLLGRELENILISHAQTELFPNRPIPGALRIKISIRLYPYYIKFKYAFSLGCYFEKVFHNMLFAYVSAQMEMGIRQEKSIRNFYRRYGIDAETYDMPAARMSLCRMKR